MLFFKNFITCFSVTAIAALMLSSLGFAQDFSTRASRSDWLLHVLGNADPNKAPGGIKFGAQFALARFYLNPKDPVAADYFTRMYDPAWCSDDDADPQMFSKPALAWALVKFKTAFSEEQRSHIKENLKKFTKLTDHGTANHALMRSVSAYLFAQIWPDETDWKRGSQTSEQLKAEAAGKLMTVYQTYFDKGYNENLSTTYTVVHLYATITLYECAEDPKLKKVAEAALLFYFANLAANQFQGVVIAPFKRANYPQRNTMLPEPSVYAATQLMIWLWWDSVSHFKPDNQGKDFLTQVDNPEITFLAFSKFRTPEIIDEIARGDGSPYDLTTSSSHTLHFSGNFWGGGKPEDCIRHLYRDRRFAIGTGFWNYDPDEHYMDDSGFSLIYQSTNRFNFIECFHPYWRTGASPKAYFWTKGLNSPFMETAHHRNTAITLFNIPSTDPWDGRGRADYAAYRKERANDLIQTALVRFPKSVQEKTEESGWIFLHEKDVYIGIYPIGKYQIDENFPDAGEFNVIRIDSNQCGFIFDVGTAPEIASFNDFRKRLISHSPSFAAATMEVKYINCNDIALRAAWRQPDYKIPRPSFVEVRADLNVNGKNILPEKMQPVLNSQPLELVDRVMKVRSAKGLLTVDWRGELPVITTGK